jgi:uncharacterized membrane protein
MPRSAHSQIRNFHRLAANFADGVALAAALIWLGVMVALAWSAGVPLFTALKRGLVGSVLVYSLFFVGLHLMFRMSSKTARKDKRAGVEARPARRQEPAQ